MLSMDFIKTSRDEVERAIRDKGVDLDVDALLGLDGEARALKTEIDELRATRNAVSAKFKDASAEEKAKLGKTAKEAGKKAGETAGDVGDRLHDSAKGFGEALLGGIKHVGKTIIGFFED